MSRLTEKVKNTDDYIKLATKDKQEFINKLGKLEDLEEQLGCPLEVVVKAIAQGIFINLDDKYPTEVYLMEDSNDYFLFNSGYEIGVNLKDYKKTWWLRRDKSE